MIAIVDYGVGNLFSLACSLKKIGQDCVVTEDKHIISVADKLILPGVGAFGNAARLLNESGLGEVVTGCAREGKPLLGICLGMQLLFDVSYEYGEHRGLGLIPGVVRPLSGDTENLKIPHMGWNSLDVKNAGCALFKYIKDGDYVYFVHSYHCVCAEENDVAATSLYGIPVTAAVARKNIFGTQFHPEKSGEVGLKILKSFCELNGGC